MKKLLVLVVVALLLLASAALAGEVFKVTAARANIRSGPGTKYDVITTASQGDRFQVLSQQGDWFQILLSGGGKGWVNSDLGAVSSTEEKQVQPAPKQEYQAKPAQTYRPRPVAGAIGDLSAGMFEFGGRADMTFDGGSTITLAPTVGYFIMEPIEIEGLLGFTHRGGDGSSSNDFTIAANGIYNFETGKAFVPIAFFGLGFTSMSFGDESKSALLMQFGGGTRMFMTDTWNVRAELVMKKVFIEGSDFTFGIEAYLTGLKVF